MTGRGKNPLRPGKLPTELLAGLLGKYASGAPGLLVGPSVGIDAAVIDFNGELVAAKSDPVTFVSEDAGEYAVHVNANDIAVMGAQPRWFLATVLLPVGAATGKTAGQIFSRISSACAEVGAVLCGGHTEVTPAVVRPVVAGHMLGTFEGRKVITAAGARPGDALVLTKGIAIEAVSVLAREFPERLAKAFSPAFVKKCAGYFRAPGISVVKDARTALESGRVNAMHDPTEGGLSGALYELSEASGCSITVEKELIPVLAESRALCEFFGLDPMGAISSGALLISTPFKEAAKIAARLAAASIGSAIIGRVGAKGRSVKITVDGKTRPLKRFERDELTRILV